MHVSLTCPLIPFLPNLQNCIMTYEISILQAHMEIGTATNLSTKIHILNTHPMYSKGKSSSHEKGGRIDVHRSSTKGTDIFHHHHHNKHYPINLSLARSIKESKDFTKVSNSLPNLASNLHKVVVITCHNNSEKESVRSKVP